jgi:hypothetical protein
MLHHVSWQILTDVSEELTAFIIRHITLMKDAVRSSETSVNVYQATRCNIPEHSHIYSFYILIVYGHWKMSVWQAFAEFIPLFT